MTARVIVVATGQLGRPGPAGGVTSVNGQTGDVIISGRSGNIDGGSASSVYGGTSGFDGGDA